MPLSNAGNRLLLAGFLCVFGIIPGYAQSPTAGAPPTAPAATPEAPKPAAPLPGLWIDGIHLSAQIQAGIMVNPNNPTSGVNYGRLFDSPVSQPTLNQLLLTANKPLDTTATGFDWGFKLQGMYGADARYTHFLGIWDQNPGPDYRNQFDIVEANVLLHFPFPTAGGMDVKAGLYPTPIGYETIDPSTNPFYSHSYLFNYGLPFKHTGILTTTHVTPLLDIYLGIDTGVNTTFSCCTGDNNSAPGGIIGFGLNMMGGNLTLVALTHIGPENARNALAPLGFDANKYLRYLSDAYLTWKVNGKLTLVTDVNWIRDDFAGFFSKGSPAPANAFGVAQYVSYALSDKLTLNLRGEIYRDDNGFFVASFVGNNDFVRSELGLPALRPILSTAPVPTTYGEITVGMTIKPNLPTPVTGMLIRPELRVDNALSGGHPFGNGNSRSSVTIGSDVVLTF